MNHDIAHCCGTLVDDRLCRLCRLCARYRAHLESLELGMEYVLYMDVPAEATPEHCPLFLPEEGGDL